MTLSRDGWDSVTRGPSRRGASALERFVADANVPESEEVFDAEDEEMASVAEDTFSTDGNADEGDAPLGADDAGDGPFFAGDDELHAVGARWPNRLPIVAGTDEISQAPALFDDSDEEEEQVGAALSSAGAPLAPDAAALRVDPARQAVNRMLAQARKTIGLGEKPPGSNHNRITVWYNKHIARIGNGPWCNMAVTYWAGLSANLAAIFAGKRIGYAYTVAHAQKFKQKGRWRVGVAGIRRGDVVFFDWGGSRLIRNVDHVGLVEQVKGKKIITIEGNTTGDRCRRVVRNARFIVGYGRPAYGR
jgi:CHAP domain